jgi:rRNA maturation endonuclease Nob1
MIQAGGVEGVRAFVIVCNGATKQAGEKADEWCPAIGHNRARKRFHLVPNPFFCAILAPFMASAAS